MDKKIYIEHGRQYERITSIAAPTLLCLILLPSLIPSFRQWLASLLLIGKALADIKIPEKIIHKISSYILSIELGSSRLLTIFD